MATKGYRASSRLARRLGGLILLCLSAVSVSTQDIGTASTTDAATTLSTGGQAGVSDVMLTSSSVATPGRTTEGNVTEMLANATEILSTVTAGPANSSDVTMTSSLPTTQAMETETEWITEIVTEIENVTVFEDTSSSGRTNSSLPNTAESTTASQENTPHSPPKTARPIHISYAIPILIFGGLLFLLMIMIFIAVISKPSRIKRTISTYNLTTSVQAREPSGYRNTAYDQGDIAEDTDLECSMQEMRLNGKTTNGEPLKSLRGLDEELTAL